MAATGVGAGDLATSAIAGSRIGWSALTAICIGAVIKYFLNEGLIRWQFDTNSTLIEGAIRYYGRLAQYLFMGYLIVWSFTVGVALMSASGISLHALIPVFKDAATAKWVYGALLSILGVILVRRGGYHWFERLMSFAIILMVTTVFVTVFFVSADMEPITPGGLIPSDIDMEWFVAVLGGVGGTVTILCYGYWVRERGRSDQTALSISRLDLLAAYAITGLLGISMVIIGGQIQISGGGASLLVQLSDILQLQLGTVAGWIFRIGAFAAIFSSLLGVWQSVPYLFTNLVQLIKNQECQVNAQSPLYQWSLYGLAIVPMVGLPFGFAGMQKLYALCGALFIPLLALTLLLLHFRPVEVKGTYRNSILLNGFLVLVIFFFGWLTFKLIF